MLHNTGWIGVGRPAFGPVPYLRNRRADCPHPALQSVAPLWFRSVIWIFELVAVSQLRSFEVIVATYRNITLLLPCISMLALISCSSASSQPIGTPPPNENQASCPQGTDQRVPYRSGTICVTNAYAQFLACLELKQLNEVVLQANNAVAGRLQGSTRGAEAGAEAQAVGQLELRYDNNADAKDCFQQYRDSYPSRGSLFTKQCDVISVVEKAHNNTTQVNSRNALDICIRCAQQRRFRVQPEQNTIAWKEAWKSPYAPPSQMANQFVSCECVLQDAGGSQPLAPNTCL